MGEAARKLQRVPRGEWRREGGRERKNALCFDDRRKKKTHSTKTTNASRRPPLCRPAPAHLGGCHPPPIRHGSAGAGAVAERPGGTRGEMTKKKAQSLPLAALALAQPRPPRSLAPSIPLPPRPRLLFPPPHSSSSTFTPRPCAACTHASPSWTRPPPTWPGAAGRPPSPARLAWARPPPSSSPSTPLTRARRRRPTAPRLSAATGPCWHSTAARGGTLTRHRAAAATRRPPGGW